MSDSMTHGNTREFAFLFEGVCQASTAFRNNRYSFKLWELNREFYCPDTSVISEPKGKTVEHDFERVYKQGVFSHCLHHCSLPSAILSSLVSLLCSFILFSLCQPTFSPHVVRCSSSSPSLCPSFMSSSSSSTKTGR